MHTRLSLVLNKVVNRNHAPLFSAPTHENGWVAPSIVAKRWQQFMEIGQLPDELDQAIALLRLPLDQLDQLFQEFASFPGSFWDAVRYAKGHSDVRETSESPLWYAASAYRNPVFPPSLFSLGAGAIFERQTDLDLVRSIVNCFPAVRNQFVASGIRLVGNAIDWSHQETRCVRGYIEVMLDPAFIFDQPAYHVLAASLIIEDAGNAGVAKDILIHRIDERQLDIEKFGNEVGKVLYMEKGKTKRLVSAMTEVARISRLHAHAVRHVLERALQGGSNIPRDISAVLELLNELLHSENARLKNPATIEHLASLSIGGKTAKLVRELITTEEQ